MEIENLNKLRGMYGGLFYTEFREGYLYKEEQYLIDHGIKKILEKNYGKYNLPEKVIAYPPHYANVFGPYCKSFRNYDPQFTEEIHEYEYFK